MNTKNNLRYKMSSEKIENAFLKLLENKQYDDITINQICKTANINRSTFYLHYHDINDLIIKIENKFAKNIANIFSYGLKQNTAAMVDMFKFIKENKIFYKAFLNIPYNTLAETNTKIEILQNIGTNIKIDKTDKFGLFYRANFFGAGIKEICKLWLERNCIETPEYMANLIAQEYVNRDSI